MAPGVACSMRRSGDVWDNVATESFFSSLKTERIGTKTYRSREEARSDVFDSFERFYNPIRRHSTTGYLSPAESKPPGPRPRSGAGFRAPSRP
jgi:putative transposase